MGILIALVLLISLLASGLWIAFSIGASGFVALWPTLGFKLFHLVGLQVWQLTSKWVMIALPLFGLMGELLARTGVANHLYNGVSKVLHGMPGGLTQTNIGACTLFAAMSGTSIAGAATMGPLSYREMVKRRGYDKGFVLGSVAAGGTLGILIPPSIPLIVYGELAGQSIGKLFIAGIVPGLMLASLFMIYIAVAGKRNPQLLGTGQEHDQRVAIGERLRGLFSIWPFLILIAIVLGAMYFGVTTPTEAAALGVVGTVVLTAGWRCLTWENFKGACMSTVRTTAMIFLLMAAAQTLSVSTGYYGVPTIIEAWALGIGSPMVLLVLVCLMYLVMGCFFDSMSMMLLTLPFVLPLLEAGGFDLVWFGIVAVITFEAGVITPPFGVNLFVLQGTTGERVEVIAKGAIPFLVCMLVALVVVINFPSIVLWLPDAMLG